MILKKFDTTEIETCQKVVKIYKNDLNLKVNEEANYKKYRDFLFK